MVFKKKQKEPEKDQGIVRVPEGAYQSIRILAVENGVVFSVQDVRGAGGEYYAPTTLSALKSLRSIELRPPRGAGGQEEQEEQEEGEVEDL